MLHIPSKLPDVGTTIFTVMSALAQEHQAINLSQGFPNYPSPPALTELVCRYLRDGANQYAPMAGVPALRQAIAAKIQHSYGIALDPETDITVTAGATQAIFTAISAFVRPGDEVIIIEPAYDCYKPAILVHGGVPVVHELAAPDYRIDWPVLAQRISPRTRMIVVNTPHNPTGTILAAVDLQALERLTEGTDIIVLSDEVYEHLVLDGRQHESVLRYPALRARSLATYSFGKTFHNTGWKVGYCVGPPALMAEFRKVHQFNVFCVNTPIQHALADFLQDSSTYTSLPDFFTRKRDLLLGALEGSGLQPLRCEGTYFHLFDYSAVSDLPDMDFAMHLTQHVGVAVIPVSAFYSQPRQERVIRICFAKTEETLVAAGERLRAHQSRYGAGSRA